MLATFIIEISYIIYIVLRYKANRLTKIGLGILVSLAIFQLAEYIICIRPSLGGAVWAKVGFVAITALLPLGVQFVYALVGRGWNWLIATAYGSSTLWMLFFVFYPGILQNYGCGGNYAIFTIKPGFGSAFLLFYYFWLYVGTLLALKLVLTQKKETPAVRRSLALFIVAYLALLIPTTTVNALKPETFVGIPSIMCGFALIMATIITFLIIPRTSILKKGKQ